MLIYDRPRCDDRTFAGVLFLTVLVFPSAAVRGQTTPAQTAIDALYPELAALYEDLHRNPELAFQESELQRRWRRVSSHSGAEVTTGVGGTGIVALLRNGPGPTAMLRTELDALPVEEKTECRLRAR